MTIDSKDNSDSHSIDACNPCGSLWHRWEPHIHIPGTLHNDQFGGEEAVDEFIERVNNSSPRIRALGITDYSVFDSYKLALEWHHQKRFPGVEILFPNIELRFAVSAGKGSPINVHLLVSPEDADHIEQAERFLNELTFIYSGETYRCTRDDLIRLGRAHKPDANNDRQALEIGSEQFKINPDDLINAFQKSEWARRNILMAIAASSNDGTAQLPAGGGLAATRKKLERAADIIFSSKEGDRKFWLGQTKMSRAKLDSEYGGVKPCLHGSDSHDLGDVGSPALDRYCWLKGDLTFEALRQVCIEPEGRAFVGQEPPKGGLPSNTITRITVDDADWLAASEVPINPGLVAVIGARGSGKSALVELIAAGANSINRSQSKGSFLTRAGDLIGSEISTLSWGEEIRRRPV